MANNITTEDTMPKKKLFSIACTWEVWGTLEIEATTLREAIKKAKADTMPLPHNGEYVDESFRVDRDGCNEVPRN